jgi:hypothetical protein
MEATMKLIEIVKRIEAAGLEPVLSTYRGGLYLSAWTIVERGKSQNLFGGTLEDGDNPTRFWGDDQVITDLEKASKHPDAVARRELQAVWAKEDEADAKKFRGRHAA